MVPGIYKRIEGVDNQDCNQKQVQKRNVFITDLEKTGRILTEKEFGRLYGSGENFPRNPKRKTLPEPIKSEESLNDTVNFEVENSSEDGQENIKEEEDVPKMLDNLKRLASNILKLAYRDHIVIDRETSEVVRTHHRTNQKTIYRFCQPAMLNLRNRSDESIGVEVKREDLIEKSRNKLGRPRKRLKEDANTRKMSNKIIKQESPSNKNEVPRDKSTKSMSNSRTRSGRLVRAPLTLAGIVSEIVSTSAESEPESMSSLLNDLGDTSYHNSKLEALDKKQDQSVTDAKIPLETNPPPIEENIGESSPKRKVPPEAICPTCHKIFLGKRLQRHFAQHPDHIKIPTITPNCPETTQLPVQQTQNGTDTDCSNPSGSGEDISLFRFLVSKLQRSQQLNEDQKADLFLSELNDLVEQLQLRSSRLIRNTSGLHFVSQRCSKLLGIPEGQYALDLTAIEFPLEPEMQDNANSHNLGSSSSTLPTHINTRSLDYTNLSITIDDTLTDEAAQKLNLSAGGKLLPPSEESLLRAVDDLVQTNINKIQSTSVVCASSDTSSLAPSNTNTTSVVANLLPPHIDHVSDNAVEAVHMKETSATVVSASENPLLDLSVDFFQFNN